jgi:hypothetical protein
MEICGRVGRDILGFVVQETFVSTIDFEDKLSNFVTLHLLKMNSYHQFV